MSSIGIIPWIFNSKIASSGNVSVEWYYIKFPESLENETDFNFRLLNAFDTLKLDAVSCAAIGPDTDTGRPSSTAAAPGRCLPPSRALPQSSAERRSAGADCFRALSPPARRPASRRVYAHRHPPSLYEARAPAVRFHAKLV